MTHALMFIALILTSPSAVLAQTTTTRIDISVEGGLELVALNFNPTDLNQTIDGLSLGVATPAQITEITKTLKVARNTKAIAVGYGYSITDTAGGSESGIVWQSLVTSQDPQTVVNELTAANNGLDAFLNAKGNEYKTKLETAKKSN